MARRSSIYSRRGAARAVLAAAILSALSCGLFVPDTGLPEEGPSQRSTPAGVIEQLFRSYENKRIDLFTDLLPKNGTYRFFISPEYSLTYTGTDAILARVEESQYAYVDPGNYHYWGQDSEIAKHRRMFANRNVDIEWKEYPIIPNEREFKYRVDENDDTTHVELRLQAGELCIGLGDTLFCTQKEQMQVFLLERERETDKKTGERLWVIKDWFDL